MNKIDKIKLMLEGQEVQVQNEIDKIRKCMVEEGMDPYEFIKQHYLLIGYKSAYQVIKKIIIKEENND